MLRVLLTLHHMRIMQDSTHNAGKKRCARSTQTPTRAILKTYSKQARHSRSRAVQRRILFTLACHVRTVQRLQTASASEWL